MRRKDFEIIQYDRDHFRVAQRLPFLWFFHIWVELTVIESNGDEVVVQYPTFEQAKDLIDGIVID